MFGSFVLPPEVKVGDYLLIAGCGAYDMSTQYNFGDGNVRTDNVIPGIVVQVSYSMHTALALPISHSAEVYSFVMWVEKDGSVCLETRTVPFTAA